MTDPGAAFVCGWGEEIFLTYGFVQSMVSQASIAYLREFVLIESTVGDAVLAPSTADGACADRHFAKGLVLFTNENCSAKEILHNVVDRAEPVCQARVQLVETDAVVDVLTLKRYFDASRAFAVVPSGNWFDRVLPAPLVRVTPSQLPAVRHIFAYGTLRPDDTSGASWTAPFADGTQWEPATVRGVSLYILEFPVVLIPPDDQCPNHGVVGTVVSCPSIDDFSRKLCMADRIEGTPRHYRRGVVRAERVDGSSVLAFLYYRTPSAFKLEKLRERYVRSGNFLRRGADYEFPQHQRQR
jgi:gamma-glutamylcyclotransferase (GGCT)/AIG2-like uncharacterized protein YtfP